ncbi:hypothetical protein TNCV_821251 [Trichonephila clavipes]|nr:hypothetical protein TNCV_821251 [Trichonephila clavipes]
MVKYLLLFLHDPIGQQFWTRSKRSQTFQKSNTSKGSSAKSCLVSPGHLRMLEGEAGLEEQFVHISKLLHPPENFIVLRWPLRKRARRV